MTIYKNFIKHSRHLYTAKNQNGFNNALYDYFGCDTDKAISKKSVRGWVQNHPTKYPSSFVIVDDVIEGGNVYIECVDLKYAIYQISCIEEY